MPNGEISGIEKSGVRGEMRSGWNGREFLGKRKSSRGRKICRLKKIGWSRSRGSLRSGCVYNSNAVDVLGH